MVQNNVRLAIRQQPKPRRGSYHDGCRRMHLAGYRLQRPLQQRLQRLGPLLRLVSVCAQSGLELIKVVRLEFQIAFYTFCKLEYVDP